MAGSVSLLWMQKGRGCPDAGQILAVKLFVLVAVNHEIIIRHQQGHCYELIEDAHVCITLHRSFIKLTVIP